MRAIKLTKGKFATVDDEDYEWLNQNTWHVSESARTDYALSHPSKNIRLSMHRVLLDCPEGMEIDHIDGNGLNNQKSNLRIVTRRENCQNLHPKKFKKVSKFPGVSFHTVTQTWYPRARVGEGGSVVKSRGYYKTEEEAHEAYLKIIKEYENE